MIPTLHLSVEVTRRKRLHLIEDESGELLRTCRTAVEAFEWLKEEEYAQVHVVLTGGTLEIRLGEYLPW